MKKLLITLGVLLATSISVFSQRLVWEKTIDYRDHPDPQWSSNDDYIVNISQVESGDFIYSAKSDSFGLAWRRVGAQFNSAIIIRKIGQTGENISTNIVLTDTINGDGISWYNPISRIFNQFYTRGNASGLWFLKRFNSNLIFAGEYSFRPRDFPDRIYPSPITMVPSIDGGFFIVGTKRITINNQSQQLWGVAKLSATAEYEWGQTYSSNFVNNEVNHVEYTANGNLLLSGWEGGQPVAKEIDDSTGNLVRTIRFPTISVGTFMKVKIYQAPQNHFIVQGQLSIDRYYTGRFDSSGTRIWGGVSGYGKSFFIVMADGSFWCTGPPGLPVTQYNFLKYAADSTLLVSVVISNQSVTGLNPSINDVIFLGDGSAIFGGSVWPGNNPSPNSPLFGTAMYLCKIDNIGRPFVTGGGPQLVLSNEEKEPESEPNLQVYPNPFTNTLRLSHKGTAQLLDVHGRVILSQPVEAGEELKVGNLPKGMYLLRLQSVGGKLYVRKVIKE
ncbi:MAG: T9SS type A sorting domain-containing protein [Flexibacteraceae bacterium]